MKFKIFAHISFEGEVDPTLLAQILDPENNDLEGVAISSSIVADKLLVDIDGTMKLGTLINTLDDIIKTAILAKDVSDTAEKN